MSPQLRTTGSGPAQPTATYEVRAADGVRLHAREWGRPHGPAILLIHGWSQCDLCWAKQVGGPLAERYRIVTFDLRGHGLSEKPREAGCYREDRTWADDVAAVIEQTGLNRPVLVAWSYGGFVVSDYLDAHGDEAIAGIELVGAAVVLSPALAHIGSGLLDHVQGACAPDLDANISAIDRFLRSCTAEPLPAEEHQRALCWNMAVPPDVRAALFAREVDGRDALGRVSVPVLVTHGRQDAIVLPSVVDEVLRACGTARVSWYERAGHMPFWEAPDRFDRELDELVDSANSPSGASARR